MYVTYYNLKDKQRVIYVSNGWSFRSITYFCSVPWLTMDDGEFIYTMSAKDYEVGNLTDLLKRNIIYVISKLFKWRLS